MNESMARVAHVALEVKTGSRREMVDLTARVAEAVRASGVRSGLCVVCVQQFPSWTAGWRSAVGRVSSSPSSTDLARPSGDETPGSDAHRKGAGRSSGNCLV